MYTTKSKVTHTNNNTGTTNQIAPPTDLPKSEAPLWRMNHEGMVYGFVYDYDRPDTPVVLPVHHYTHRTHSGNWRIIVPFNEPRAFKDKAQYRDTYKLNAQNLGLVGIDQAPCNINSWFYFRPSGERLIEHKGTEFVPEVPDAAQYKNNVKVGRPKTYTGAGVLTIFKKVHRLHTCGRYRVDYSHIKQHSCHLHNEGDGVQFNNYSGIHAYHTTCVEKIRAWVEQVGLEGKKIDSLISSMLGGDRNAYTILYLTNAICEAKLSFGAVMMCYIDPILHGNLLDLDALDIGSSEGVMLLREQVLANGVVCDKGQYYVFDGRVYVHKHKTDLENMLKDKLNVFVEYKTPTNKNWRTLRSAVIDDIIGASSEVDKSAKNYLVLNNKRLHLGGGQIEVQKHDKDVFLTRKLNYNYDQSATCPTWERTLDQLLPNKDAQAMLQEWAGYCLVYERTFEKFLFLYGIGGAGKNTIGETLEALVPSSAATLDALYDTSNYAHMTKNTMLFIDEANSTLGNKMLQTIKKLTSTGTVSWRVFYTQLEEVSETFPKLTLTANDAERVFQSLDGALKRRILALEFNQTVLKKDPHLKNKLLKELSGILNWAIEGYKRLYKNDGFTNYNDLIKLDESINGEVLDFRDEILAMVENVDAEKDNWYSGTSLLENYAGNVPYTSIQFGVMLRKAFVQSPNHKKRVNKKVCYLIQ